MQTFKFKDAWRHQENFALDRNTGMITMKKGMDFQGKESLTFSIDFLVEDPIHGQVGSRAVPANVNVTVQKIPHEAVVKSGSVRISGTPEDFVRPDKNGFSNRDRFAKKMASPALLNATHFDVFTVMPVVGQGSAVKMTDVRFAAHGSPYFAPERMEGVLARSRDDLQLSLGVDIIMVRVDECLDEKGGKCGGRGRGKDASWTGKARAS